MLTCVLILLQVVDGRGLFSPFMVFLKACRDRGHGLQTILLLTIYMLTYHMHC